MVFKALSDEIIRRQATDGEDSGLDSEALQLFTG